MKAKHLFALALGIVVCASGAARAQTGQYQDRVTQAQVLLPPPYSNDRWRLRRDADRLNQMLSWVRDRMRRYGAGRRSWRELSQIQNDISRINHRIAINYPDRDSIRRDIRRSRKGLQQLEDNLRFAPGDYYRW